MKIYVLYYVPWGKKVKTPISGNRKITARGAGGRTGNDAAIGMGKTVALSVRSSLSGNLYALIEKLQRPDIECRQYQNGFAPLLRNCNPVGRMSDKPPLMLDIGSDDGHFSGDDGRFFRDVGYFSFHVGQIFFHIEHKF